MGYSNSFDTAMEIIDTFSKEHSERLELVSERLDIFAEYCEAIDLIADYNSAKCVAFKIDDDSDDNTVICKMMLPELVAVTSRSLFCDLVARSIDFSVENVEKAVVLTFVFPSLWKEKSKGQSAEK